MFDLSSTTWCDTFVSPPPITINSFEFMLRPARLPLTSQTDVRHIMRMAREHKWQLDRRRVLTFLQNPRHALLLTDAQQRIEFVSHGFVSMTGYTPEEALGKSPAFLQGPKTSPESRQRLKNNLQTSDIFQGDLLNYRKNGETYWCHVDIFPLHNPLQQVTHYMAFEWEVTE